MPSDMFFFEKRTVFAASECKNHVYWTILQKTFFPPSKMFRNFSFVLIAEIEDIFVIFAKIIFNDGIKNFSSC